MKKPLMLTMKFHCYYDKKKETVEKTIMKQTKN